MTRAGQRSGAFHHLVEDGLQIEARTDAQHRRSQTGMARLMSLLGDFSVVRITHGICPLPAAGWPDRLPEDAEFVLKSCKN